MSTDERQLEPEDQALGWAPIDLLLSQGNADEIARMRQQVAEDPMQALELADTVAVLEQLRQVRVEASPLYATKLARVAGRAERRLVGRDDTHRQPRYLPMVTVLAAAATFACLWLLDPVHRWADDASPVSFAVDATVEPDGADGELRSGAPGLGRQIEVLPPEFSAVAWDSAVEVMRRRLDLEPSPRMRDAFEAGLQDARDPLAEWLDPRNALVLLRLDHEMRANADVRAEALRRRGGLPAVDRRVQELADAIADDLLQQWFRREQLAEVAWGMRALIGAGSTATRVEALRRSGDWLAEALPELHGDQLVVALSGMVELAAISGQHFETVAEHGIRLVEEVLQPDDETWSRRRPDLVGGRIKTGTLGEAGRVLARLPAFGADAERCTLVRQLVLGQLRERRDRGQERPDVLAAMLYGCADLLAEAERDGLEATLKRWKPVRLASDFQTVQQLAWGMQPGRSGFARLQRELRQLTVLPIPAGVRERAAFCLCLATNYAGFVGGLLPATSAPRRI